MTLTVTSPAIEPADAAPADTSELLLPAGDAPSTERPNQNVAVPAGRVVIAGVLACLGAAWPVARLFHDSALALVLCALGVFVGAASAWQAARRSRSAWLYAALPVALVSGAGVVAPFATGGSANLAGLVREAVREGGLAQAPVALLPGWRFLLVVFFCALTTTALSFALGSARPRLVLVACAPVALAASLLQPKGSEVLGAVPAAVLLMAAQTIAGGADLAAQGVAVAAFERRRLLRGAAMLLVTIAALTAVSQTSFLYPHTQKDTVVPPRKPPPSPPLPDRELFRVDTAEKLAFRVGVLDVYGQNALLLPPYDPRRERSVRDGLAAVDGSLKPQRTVNVTIGDLPGQTLPIPAQGVAASGLSGAVVDPRTDVVRFTDKRVPRGLHYTVVVAPVPTATDLDKAPPAPASIQTSYTQMPAPPDQVQRLLDRAPRAPLFDRLQYVRNVLYRSVVAAGAGRPADVTPNDVASMLAGGSASPYQIVVAEVMLARWAGIPARMGYGFLDGELLADKKSQVFRPRNGAAWLEAYFGGRGWYPFFGVPPKARASLTNAHKNTNPNIHPSQDLALPVFVPVRNSSFRATYEVARYYTLLALPFVALLVALYLSIPALCKRLRRMRRRSWARSRGPAARILVAYAGMRDRMHDLNVGDPTASALEFVEDIDPDDEHDELAWLYTRAIYGDLGRDLQDDDVRAAEEMAASLARRVADAQTVVNRAVAWLARSSLRDPFTREIPNAWPEPGARSARRRVGRARVRTWIGSRLRRSGAVGATPALVVLLLLTGMFTTGCSATSARADTPAALPGGALPTSALGCTLVREPSGEEKFALVGSRGLVERGLVFSVHCADSVVGSVQLDVIKRHYKTQDAHVQSQLEAGFRTGSFATEHFGVLRLRRSESFGLQTWLWFPSDENVLEVFVMRGDFTDADRYVKAVLASQLGWATPPPVPTASAVAPQPSTSGSGS